MTKSAILGVAMTAALLASSRLSAQEWANKMFKTLDHDFGTVARGADTVYKFEVTNLYKQDMNLINVRSSCGCTSPSIENPIIKTYEKAYIVARFNTRTHIGQRAATLTVTLGAPYSAEVQLHVHGNIRSDVVFTPGALEFGDTYAGAPTEQKISVDYAGRSDWAITDVTNDNDNFEVELNEKARTPGRVSYDLLVRMKPGTPIGRIKDQLTVVTNDGRPDNQRIPLYVSAHIRPEFSVTPEQLILGDMKPGEEKSRRIVVRGREPFKITDISCGDDCFEFKKDDEVRAVHFVEVMFKAGENPGKLQTPIRILTDKGENRGATCVASATVIDVPAEIPPAEPTAEPPAAGDQTGGLENTGAVQTAAAE